MCIRDSYIHIQNCIHEAAKETLGCYEKERKTTPYWRNKEIELLIKNKKEKYKKFLTTKTVEDKITYKEAQAAVRRMITQRKNKTFGPTEYLYSCLLYTSRCV